MKNQTYAATPPRWGTSSRRRFALCRIGMVLLLLIVGMGLPGSAQESAEANLSDVELARVLQTRLDEGVRLLGLVGASASVLTPGGGQWHGASGMSDPIGGEPVQPDMLFGAGSITKNFVAALILQLAEEGLLTLDDTVGQWLPEYPNIDSGITIRQLLNHTSGVFNFTDHPEFGSIFIDPARAWAPEENIALFVGAPAFAPGTWQQYSNTNYLLAGLIIEQATGGAVSQQLRQRFWDPLQLTSTFLDVEEQINGNLAHGWGDLGDGLQDLAPLPRTALYSSMWTAGAVISSADDLARWGQALFGGRVLGAESLEAMLAFQPVMDYGLGAFRIVLQGRQLWGHNGGDLGYAALMLYEPRDGICISVMLNIGRDSLPVPNSDIILVDALLGAVLDARAVPTAVHTTEATRPESFRLHQNHPNPFNPQTSITYELASPGPVSLVIYNVHGQRVRTLVDGHKGMGLHRATWDGTDHSGLHSGTGTYFYRLQTVDAVQSRQMLLVR